MAAMKPKPPGYWTDERVLAEGRKYSSRGEFQRANKGAYHVALRRDLLDQLYPSKRADFADWSDDEVVLAEGRRFSSRKEFKHGNVSAYQAALRRDLLDQLYPSKRADFAKRADHAKWSDERVLEEGRKYASRADFARGNGGVYQAARRRNLLDQLYLSKNDLRNDWGDNDLLLAEGRKYDSRADFARGNASAYQIAWRRNLLHLIDFPENNAPTDNDTIYLWRAVGQFHNDVPVFKIGVTSQRLGDVRIKQVARDAGFTAALVAAVPTWLPASYAEEHLHGFGVDPQWRGFDGATEFRALNAVELDQVLHLMNAYACPGEEAGVALHEHLA